MSTPPVLRDLAPRFMQRTRTASTRRNASRARRMGGVGLLRSNSAMCWAPASLPRFFDEKLAFACEHGADEVVNYSSEKLRDDSGASAASMASMSLRSGGRRLSERRYARLTGRVYLSSASLFTNLNPAESRPVARMRYSRRFLGLMGSATMALCALVDIARWASEGKLSLYLHATYPLAEIATAMRLSATVRSWENRAAGLIRHREAAPPSSCRFGIRA